MFESKPEVLPHVQVLSIVLQLGALFSEAEERLGGSAYGIAVGHLGETLKVTSDPPTWASLCF